jgi:hypothetical protein
MLLTLNKAISPIPYQLLISLMGKEVIFYKVPV